MTAPGARPAALGLALAVLATAPVASGPHIENSAAELETRLTVIDAPASRRTE